MPTNELLEAKYRAQRALSEQGGDDLHAYARNVHRVVTDVERKYGLRFRYRPSRREAAPSQDPSSTPAAQPSGNAAA